SAQERPQPESETPAPETPAAKAPELQDKIVTTHHKAVIGGSSIAYTASAGTLVLRDEAGKAKASMFLVAYTRDGIQDVSRRPITFLYNGGPGSSSVWLHMGALGPRRVVLDDEGMALAPPYRLVDSGESLLDITDLVFIDPVITGYSRPAAGENARQFHGLREDVESVGQLVHLYVTRNKRWSSPKFLGGESYGTTRSAALVQHLQDRYGMYFNGVVLISSILNFQTARFEVGNDLPYPLFLPTYTAAAWYHKRLPADLQGDLRQALEEAEQFALGDYLVALAQGNDLPPERREEVARKVARLTGLSEDYVARVNLRPEIDGFTKELMRSERQTVGRLDTRFKGLDLSAEGVEPEFDPSYAAILGPFSGVLNDYLRRDLGFESDLPYEILTARVRPWNYGEFQNRFVNVAEDLRQAMSRNPALRVFVGNGYYDLATPYFATEYTFDHLAFDPGYAERITKAYYEAGHMMYVRKADREKLKRDLAEFIQSASGD
ncbi:MAG TPA: peptidase S10, partial [Thermoanaerobaculia bacterium]|nr:peptidase S10 [Thermoanaerobaculia bacterium]